MTKISIILPVYNGEKDLCRCLDSIYNQSYKDYEIVAINDGSTDSSIDILKEYKNRFRSKITVVDQENSGVAQTRNNGIEMAKGEYITFMDDDDYLDADYLETLVKEADSDSYDILISGYRRITREGKVLFSSKIKNKVFQKYIIVAPWARLFKRTFLIEQKIRFFQYDIGEDVCFNIHAYQKTERIKIVDYIGYNWVYNEVSVSNTSQRGFKDGIDVLYLLDRIKSLVPMNNFTIEYFYVRYIVWFLLFSGKTAKNSEFNKECDRLFKWLSENNIKLGLHIFSNEIAGESFNRFVVWIFYIMYKLKLIPVFSKIYCTR